jgi:hypothetical protein
MRTQKEILGATILGTRGDEAIHCVLDTMYARAPYTVLQKAMHIHPTVSELIPTILGELQPLQDDVDARARSNVLGWTCQVSGWLSEIVGTRSKTFCDDQ